MSDPIPLIAAAAELRAIAERAIDVLESAPSILERDRGSREDRRWNLAAGAALTALRFVAGAAAVWPDPSLLPVLARGFDELDGWNDLHRGSHEVVAYAIQCVIEAGAPINETVTELAEHPNQDIREAVARGLSPKNARAVPLLSKLALDPIADVRNPAREALGDVPFWLGKFDSDPLARLSDREAEAHKQTLEELSALLDEPRDTLVRRDEDLARLAGALPDPLAVEVARIVLAAGGGTFGDFTRLGAMMVAREGGIDALLQVCRAWAELPRFSLGDAHIEMVSRAPAEVRLSACVALARFAISEPASERAELRGAPAIAAQIAARAFPLDADASPIFDLCSADREDEDDGSDDRAFIELCRIWRREGLDVGPFADRILAARLAGFRGRWKHMWGIEARLAALPRETLRAAATEAFGKDDEGTVRWGIETLLFAAHDPERDPDPIDLALKFWDDPRLRSIVLEHHDLPKIFVSFLRPALRRGELSFSHAAKTVRTIEALWPARSPAEERYQPLFGPEDLQGPPTEAELSVMRRVRDAHVFAGDRDWLAALDALPRGPWHPEDLAFMERAVRGCVEGDLDLHYLVALELRNRPSPAVLPLFDRLIIPGHEEAHALRSMLRDTREKLGLGPADDEDEDEDEAAGEWMDEDD